MIPRCPLCSEDLRPLAPGRRDVVGCRPCALVWIPVAARGKTARSADVDPNRLGWIDCPACARRSMKPGDDQSGPHWQCMRCAGRVYVRGEREPAAPRASTGTDRFLEWAFSILVGIGETLDG